MDARFTDKREFLHPVSHSCELRMELDRREIAQITYADDSRVARQFAYAPPLVRPTVSALRDFLRRELNIDGSFLPHLDELNNLTGNVFDPD